jgi:hypothetical protein
MVSRRPVLLCDEYLLCTSRILLPTLIQTLSLRLRVLTSSSSSLPFFSDWALTTYLRLGIFYAVFRFFMSSSRPYRSIYIVVLASKPSFITNPDLHLKRSGISAQLSLKHNRMRTPHTGAHVHPEMGVVMSSLSLSYSAVTLRARTQYRTQPVPMAFGPIH